MQAAILAPVILDAIEATDRLSEYNSGEIFLTDEEQLEQLVVMGAGLSAMKTWALTHDPDRYEKCFM